MNGLSTSKQPAVERDNLAQYAGRWVALVGSQVVGQGGTPKQALRAAKANRSKESPIIIYVPPLNPISSPELLHQIIAAIPGHVPLYLVGGAVRDIMLGRITQDLDFVVPANAMEHARSVANHLGAAYFPLDEQRETARLILPGPEGQGIILDFATYRGYDLESDLRGRDFTINAMAMDLRKDMAIIDPLSGVSDLRAKRLRACSPMSIEDDPLRIVRAIRLASSYQLHILPETRALMRSAVNALPSVSPERLRDELIKILAGPQPHTCIRALDLLGALTYILPEMTTLKGVEQSPPHVEQVWEHTLGVVQQLENVLQALQEKFDQDSAANLTMGLLVLHLGRFRGEIGQHFRNRLTSNRPLRGLMFLAALYHDIGKPQTKTMDEEGRSRFFRHEQAGELIIAERARQLRLSNLEIDRARLIVRNHLRPVLLTQNSPKVTRRAIYRFFKDTGAAGVDICLLSLADVLATHGPSISAEQWVSHLETTRILFQAWWDYPQESISPPPIVNGRDLMAELDLQPGPVIGELLEIIRENQAIGKVNTKEEALSLVRYLLKNPSEKRY